MGPLHDPVTWYKIIYTGEQVAQWDFQNNATRTSSPGPAFVLKVPLRNLLTSIYNFVPCDWVVQRAHRDKYTMLRSKYTMIRDTPSTYRFLVLTKRSAASGDENGLICRSNRHTVNYHTLVNSQLRILHF